MAHFSVQLIVQFIWSYAHPQRSLSLSLTHPPTHLLSLSLSPIDCHNFLSNAQKLAHTCSDTSNVDDTADVVAAAAVAANLAYFFIHFVVAEAGCFYTVVILFLFLDLSN